MRAVRTKDREELVRRFGLNEPLATRVTAFLTRGVDMSETVLEAAAADATLGKALLEDELLREGEPLDEECLRDAAHRHGYGGSGRLRVAVRPGGWRTIAFQGELTAGQQSASSLPESGMEMIHSPPHQPLTRPESEELFSPRDIANLKLEALTGQDPRKRIEAVRRLVYVPGAGTEKAGIFVNVINDDTADDTLRREALKGLEEMGLDPELAEPLRQLLGGEESAATGAIQRIASVFAGVGDGQTGVVLAVLLGLAERVDSTAVRVGLISLIAREAHILSRSTERLRRFIRLLLRQLNMDAMRSRQRSVSKALRACYEVAPDSVGQQVWEELERTASPIVKGFLIRQIAEFGGDATRERDLADIALEEIISGDLSEEQRSYLRNGLVPIGEPAVSAVERKLNDTFGHTRSELVSLLDMLCRECRVPDESLLKVVRTMLRLLKVAGRNTRRRILEASIFAAPAIPAELRADIASELLSHITEFEMPATREDIFHSLKQLGAPAIPPILHYLRRHFAEKESEVVFVTLGAIAQEAGGDTPDAQARESIDFCMSILDKEASRHGKSCIALAGLCGYSRTGGELMDNLVVILQEKLWESRYTFDIIEALGILAGSPNVKARHQHDIFNILSHIATLRTEATMGIERESENGRVYEFGKGIRFETIVIPAAVKGLERISVSSQTDEWLRSEVVKRLLVLWEGVSHMRIVWSPAAVEALVNAIGTVASSDYIASGIRVRLGRALLNYMNKTSVINNLGRICSVPDGGEEIMELSMTASEHLLAEWANSHDEDMERRAAILTSLGAIAANTAFDSHNQRIVEMRENVIDSLFQGLRTGIIQVKEPLELLLDCDGLSERQRAEIQTRLENAYGLVRSEG